MNILNVIRQNKKKKVAIAIAASVQLKKSTIKDIF